jgi:hypothetical protein
MQKYHVSRQLIKNIKRKSYIETIFNEYTAYADLVFCPGKDYLDLYKAYASKDCTGSDNLAVEHLRTANYFSIRVFTGNGEWIGNIYMLDFIETQGIMLVDRIQIMRHLSLNFINFFETLKEVFAEMFENAGYQKILLPEAISNHEALQTTFNRYKKKLKRDDSIMRISSSKYFASLMNWSYYKLIDRTE